MDTLPLYQRHAAHYRDAIVSGALPQGSRFPSVRQLMRRHEVSLTTALQVCRFLEQQGWLEARPRSGYFVRQPRALRAASRPEGEEQLPRAPLDPAQYVGIHRQVSEILALGQLHPVRINLGGSRCSPRHYPGPLLHRAAQRALRAHPDLLVTPTSFRGEAVFRQIVAERATASGLALSPDDILVTQGCLEALNLALRAVTQPGDIVAVESPTFYGILQVLETLGLRALEIPTSVHTGISLEACELAFRQPGGVKALLVVPQQQNPLGCNMPDAHKQRLVQLCAEHGVALIEDDTYTALVEGPTPRALKSWDQTGNVMLCSTVHKYLAPGLRLGWISAGRWQARVEMLKYAQNRNNEALPQLAVAEVMASPAFERHLHRLRARIRQQREQTAATILRHFPAGTRLNEHNDGLALWVELPGAVDSRQLFDRALAEGILIAPGLMFSNSPRFNHCLRLNCGWDFTPETAAGIARLGQMAGEGL